MVRQVIGSVKSETVSPFLHVRLTVFFYRGRFRVYIEPGEDGWSRQMVRRENMEQVSVLRITIMSLIKMLSEMDVAA